MSMTAMCAVILSSCEIDYNISHKDIEPRVVVNALITPKQPFAVQLHWSRNYSAESGFSPVAKAEIHLYEDNAEVVCCTANPTGVTETTFQATAGHSYRLIVTVPGYGDLSAQTTIPEAPTTTISFVLQKGWYRHFDMTNLSISSAVKAIWIKGQQKYQDESSAINNFYTVSAYVDQVNGANEAYESADKGSTIEFEKFLRIPGENCKIAMPLRFSVFGGEDDKNTFQIITASDAYDRYMRSRYKHDLNTGESAQENPFIEQITVYSNIDNGLGIFAGYNYFTTPEL